MFVLYLLFRDILQAVVTGFSNPDFLSTARAPFFTWFAALVSVDSVKFLSIRVQLLTLDLRPLT